MKKIIALLICALLLFSACTANLETEQTKIPESEVAIEIETTALEEIEQLETVAEELTLEEQQALYEESLNFTGLNDPELHQYITDCVYAELASTLSNDDYRIEGVIVGYQSQEYIEDLAHNTRENVFFGYNINQLEQEFNGKRFEFFLDESGETNVREFEEYDDTTEKIITNVAIGAGVIIILVVVTIVTYGSDVPAIAAICSISGAAAKGAAIGAASGALISGAVSGVITGISTNDMDAALKAAALSGSEGFKWGAISGAITGGASKALELAKAGNTAATTIPTWRQSEVNALKTYGGSEQITYLAGQEVAYGTAGATRPDVVRTLADGTIEAIEVKNYNLASAASTNSMNNELLREVTARVQNLPAGSKQRIVLDVTGRNYSTELINSVKTSIWDKLADVYPNILIDIIGEKYENSK